MNRDPELEFERLPRAERLARFGRATLDCIFRSLPGMAIVVGLPVYRAEPTQRQQFLQEIDRLEVYANEAGRHDREL